MHLGHQKGEVLTVPALVGFHLLDEVFLPSDEFSSLLLVLLLGSVLLELVHLEMSER